MIVLSVLPACERSPQKRVDAFEILTPAAGPAPRINGPKIFGTHPGAPFLFQIAATGRRPMEFEAADLPAGLSLDRKTGLITGSLPEKRDSRVTLRATNELRRVERELRIVAGDRIALTPPMGWNSWNVWGGNITQEKVARAARAMAASGLREHGWSYVNLDDGWQGRRGGAFEAIQPNAKFPDLPELSAEIHGLGLKLGIYSTPWRTSFHGHIGSSADNPDGSNEWTNNGTHNEFFKYRFPKFESLLDKFTWLKGLADWRKEKEREKIQKSLRTFGKYSFVRQDVAQWNAWEVDYLKYDWVPVDLAHVEEMRKELGLVGRDIVYSVANNAPFVLGPNLSRLTSSWRTSGDVKDDWRSLSQTAFSRDRWAALNGPGHYNDPDMLVIGYVGWGKRRPTQLNSDEQYTQMSMWCLMSAPLLLGCDLEMLDPFTLGLITNDEVLAIDQDSLGKQATRVAHVGNVDVYAKPLEDGSWAVGLFNRGNSQTKGAVRWKDLGVSGSHSVRDLWRQKDLGVFEEKFETMVAAHGVVLVQMTEAK